MSNLYTDLPPRTYSLSDFNGRCHDLEGSAEFVTFALTGEANDHQVVLDPNRAIIDADTDLTISRDYDSVIGIAPNIVVTTSISVYPLPDSADTLSSSIHLKHSFGDRVVAYHQIPNFKIALWNQRHQIHILFPSLINDPDCSGPYLSSTQKQIFYNKGLRPAIERLLPAEASDWPPTYESEQFRARKNTGHIAPQTKMVPRWKVPYLAEIIKEMLRDNEVEWGSDLFFIHSIRGTKHATSHGDTVEGATVALREFLAESAIGEESIASGEWWVDVGLEISSADKICLQWRTSSHFHMVRWGLQIPDNHAVRVTSLGSSKYSKDLASHLTGVSGCRIEPGIQAQGPFEVTYLQMYTTDKALTYSPEGMFHGKAITVKSAMGNTQPSPFVLGLKTVYSDASWVNSSNARLEVRVPYRHATNVLQECPIELLCENLLGFDTYDWWKFREFRLSALSEILERQAFGPSQLRVKPDALVLTAACMWLINSLHSRPDDGPSARNLMRAALPLTQDEPHSETLLCAPSAYSSEDDVDEIDGTPFNPYGLIFLRRIKIVENAVPRMRAGGPGLNAAAFQFLFKRSLEEITHQYHRVGIVPRGAVKAKRVTTDKLHQTPTHRSLSNSPQTSQKNVFSLASMGYSLPPPAVDDGSDVEMEEPADVIDTRASRIWRQFLIDIALKTPNARGRTPGSYFKPQKDQRLQVTEALYNDDNLSEMWHACQVRLANDQEWDRAFGHLFPPKGHETSGRVQNYEQCTYYLMWRDVMTSCDGRTAKALRAAMSLKVRCLKWIPNACQDKVWSTKNDPMRFTRLPRGSKGAAPQILLRYPPKWNGRQVMCR